MDNNIKFKAKKKQRKLLQKMGTISKHLINNSIMNVGLCLTSQGPILRID